MSRLGADVRSLEAAAAAMRAAARELEHIGTRTSASIRRAAWQGTDADRFMTRWSRVHRARLSEVAGRCRGAAAVLDRNAAEQNRASMPAGASGRGPAGPGRETASVVKPAALPRRVDVYTFGGEATLGVGAGAVAGTVTVEHVGRGRLRVSQTQRLGAGGSLGAGTGASVIVRGRPLASLGGSAAGEVRLEQTVTRTWTIEDDHLPLLTAGLLAEATPLGWANLAVDRFGQGLDGLAALVGLDLPLGEGSSFPFLPSPDRTELLTGAVLTGTLAAGTGPKAATAAASSASSLAVGTSAGRSERTWIAEWNGTNSASLPGPLSRALGLDPAAPTQTVSARLEVPEDGRGTATLTVTSTAGDRRTVLRAAVPTEIVAKARGAAERAATAALVGAPASAVLAQEALGLLEEVSVIDVTTGSAESHGATVPVAVGPATAEIAASRTRITQLPVASTGTETGTG